MKVCVCSSQEKREKIRQAEQANAESAKPKKIDLDALGWKRGGYDIVYQGSKLNNIV